MPQKVDIYEVVVPALQPLRYAFSNTVLMPRIPRSLVDSPYDRTLERLKHVAIFQALLSHLLVIAQAGDLWKDTREVLFSPDAERISVR
jgi:hypothetical protein